MEEERNGNPYGQLDLGQLMAGTGRTRFPATPQPQPQPSSDPEEPFMFSGLPRGRGGLPEFGGHNTTTTTKVVTPAVGTGTSVASSSVAQFGFGFGFGFGLEMMNAGNTGGGGDGHGVGSSSSTSRWPRQETLTLLEIRSRLHFKFKETNQKGPLWDEVSRIMWEEHGHQRSGRKCREKFENLYKYYKKTKEGKSGRRQDGKHYRFFRQLEALCGEPSHEFTSDSEINLAKQNLYYQTTNNFSTHGQENQEALHDHHHQKLCKSLSRSNSSEFETSSSINNGDDDLSTIAFMLNRSTIKKKELNEEGQCLRSIRESLKTDVDECLDSGMRKLMDTQEAWMENMLKRIEQKEEERMIREEEWRREDAARIDQEYKFWADERARVEARDTAVVEALQRFTKKELKVSLPKKIHDHDKKMEGDNITEEILNNTNTSTGWLEVPEISTFIHLRTSMEPRFQESGYSKDCLWEEISAKMGCLGYDWTVIRCKETWENLRSFYLNKTMECEKRGMQNSRTCNYFKQFSSYYHG